MRNTLRISAVATVVAVAAAVWPANPASAGPSCPDGNHCAFWTDIGSANKNFFNSDPDFRNDTFSNGASVDNNIASASNSSTGNAYRSQYYYGYNYSNPNFCVNPGGAVWRSQLTTDGIAGNYVGQQDESGSLRLIAGRSTACFG